MLQLKSVVLHRECNCTLTAAVKLQAPRFLYIAMIQEVPNMLLVVRANTTAIYLLTNIFALSHLAVSTGWHAVGITQSFLHLHLQMDRMISMIQN